MTTDNWIALIGIATGVVVPVVAALAASHISLLIKVGKIETAFMMLGKKALVSLHSPHTPEFDRLIEKFASHEQTLTDAEWKELQTWVAQIYLDPENDSDKRGMAYFVAVLCKSKILVPTKTPPDA